MLPARVGAEVAASKTRLTTRRMGVGVSPIHPDPVGVVDATAAGRAPQYAATLR